MEEKNCYQDEKLISYLKKNIKERVHVDNVYKKLLLDILLRRAYEFELTPKEIERDLEALVKGLKKIEIRKIRQKGIIGNYTPITKRIILDEDFVKDALARHAEEEIYQTLTHEVYHALDFGRNSKYRLEAINRFKNKTYRELPEAIIEKASNRTVFPRTGENAPYYQKNVRGYIRITFITDVIAATYGVTEKEFLKNALRGRERLVNYLSRKGHESPDETARFLEKLEINVSNLYKAARPKQFRESQEDFETRKVVLKKNFAHIFYLAEKKFIQRIKNTPIREISDGEMFVQELNFNFNKLQCILSDEILISRTKSEVTDIIEFTERKLSDVMQDGMCLINNIHQVVLHCQRNKVSMNQGLIAIAKKNNVTVRSATCLDDIGLPEYTSTYDYQMDNLARKKYYESDFSGGKWDNQKISKYIANRFPVKIGKGFFGLFLAIRDQLFLKNKMLYSAEYVDEYDGEELLTDFPTDFQETNEKDPFRRLTDEELKQLNSSKPLNPGNKNTRRNKRTDRFEGIR